MNCTPPRAVFLALAAAAILPGCGSGCTRAVHNKAETAINARLPRFLGPADRYETKIDGRTDALLRGHVRAVHINGLNVRLTPTLLVNRLQLDLSDISADTGGGRIEKIGEARFFARLTESAVLHYALSRPHPLKGLDVSFEGDGNALVTARPEIAGHPTLPVTLRGVIRLEADGRRLDFFPDAANVNVWGKKRKVPLPRFVSAYITSHVNPVADLRDAPLPIRAQSVSVERGAVTLTGIVPPDALKAALAGTEAK